MNPLSDLYTILLLMNATPKWLSLSRSERTAFFKETIAPVFRKFSYSCRIRLFDSEYFHASVSDFMLIETDNLRDYRHLMEHLRDSKIYTEPYFEIKDIVVGQEEAFREFDQQQMKNGEF